MIDILEKKRVFPFFEISIEYPGILMKFSFCLSSSCFLLFSFKQKKEIRLDWIMRKDSMLNQLYFIFIDVIRSYRRIYWLTDCIYSFYFQFHFILLLQIDDKELSINEMIFWIFRFHWYYPSYWFGRFSF